MSLARGKYGIEYNPRPLDNEPSGLGLLIAAIALVAAASFAWRMIAHRRDASDAASLDSFATTNEYSAAKGVKGSEEVKSKVNEEVKSNEEAKSTSLSHRPANVRNLLMRLAEAEKAGDIELEASTIETLRALPGSPVADLDDALARRLGALNVKRLFEKHNAQWVKTVVVKRGDTASRLAAANGSTVASFARLNGGDIDRVVLGAKGLGMNHPRFNLVFHRRTRTAHLSLNGKFFKRFDLASAVTGAAGAYAVGEVRRELWKQIGADFAAEDRKEIETLLPVGSSVLVSEM